VNDLFTSQCPPRVTASWKQFLPTKDTTKNFHLRINFLLRGTEALTCYEYYWDSVRAKPDHDFRSHFLDWCKGGGVYSL